MTPAQLMKWLWHRFPFKEGVLEGVSYPKRVLRRLRLQRYRRKAHRPLVSVKILVVMNGGIGNAVFATPLVQAIRMRWPRAHITILPPKGDLFNGWCVADRVLAAGEPLYKAPFAHTFITWSSRIPECTASCDLGRVHRSEGVYARWLLKPEAEQNMKTIRRLGYRGPTPPLYVSLRKPAEPIPPSSLRIALIPGGKPEHRWRHKRWPYYRPLVEALLAQYPDSRLCIIGARDDEFPGELPDAPQILDFRGRFTLRETAWVLKHCDLAIGNDCGPMHIADAVMTPSIVIFGPTCALKNGPVYRGMPLSRDAACSPCQYDPPLRDSCQDPRCMEELGVDTVLREADRTLADRA